MKKTLASAALLLSIGLTGCANKGKTSDTAANDISPPPPPTAYQPTTPMPLAASKEVPASNVEFTSSTPVTAEPAVSTGTWKPAAKTASKTVAHSGSAVKASSKEIGGKKYIVQKGATLSSIAK